MTLEKIESYTYNVGGLHVRLDIWDTPGSENLFTGIPEK